MWQVVGHEEAVALLARSLEKDMLSHAYLFVGPPQVGKMTLALSLAQGVNCIAPPASRPCSECSQCRRIAQGHHPDVQVIDLEVPGMAEAMRMETLKNTPFAMLSRSVAGIRGNTLIITLPGSPRGVKECLDVVSPVLHHALELLRTETVSEHPR